MFATSKNLWWLSLLQCLSILVIEVISNGLVHGRWTLPSEDADSAVDGAGANGAANTANHAGTTAKKQL
jgi:hypothetical protein